MPQQSINTLFKQQALKQSNNTTSKPTQSVSSAYVGQRPKKRSAVNTAGANELVDDPIDDDGLEVVEERWKDKRRRLQNDLSGKTFVSDGKGALLHITIAPSGKCPIA